MKYSLELGPEVRHDLDSAFQWYEGQRSGLGDEFLSAIEESLERILQAPHTYGVFRREIRAPAVHRFPFVVYYRIEAMQIVVIAIQHGHRSTRNWLRRV